MNNRYPKWHFGILAIGMFFLFGCSSSEPAVAPPAGEARVIELVKKTSGNWDALSADEKEELTKELGKGDERAAMMSFRARSSVGGPPRPGP